LLAKQIAKEKIRVLMNFLRYYIRFENQDINTKFEQQVEILTERSNTMGIEELLLDRAERKGEKKGERKGEKKGEIRGRSEGEKAKAIAIAREMKKEGMPVAQIEKFTGLSAGEIEKL
jgi:predicted transposase/invertase (TIGR01784 family)